MEGETLTGTVTLAQRLKQLGTIRILDLAQAANVRGLRQEWIYGGTYYFLPPSGMTGAELQREMDGFKERDEFHLSYNAQSAIDISHKPLLTLDSFADKYF